jgi:HAD superfamily hydrolase (TIGR01509 family)
MIKLVCFDLDGVLVDSKETHFESLNMALSEQDEKFVIGHEEHIKKYDGLPTTKKMEMLHREKGLPKDLFDTVWRRKQELTQNVISKFVRPDEQIIEAFKTIHERGIKIFVCSNSIRQTTKMYLLSLGLMRWVDDYISNEDVRHPKPNPSMYLKAMLKAGVSPAETLIVEDSHVGVKAAVASGANLLVVGSPSEVSKEAMCSEVERLNKGHRRPWRNKEMNILIPMAGAGSRFAQAGYTFPKPLIEVWGKPMIQVVVENINIDANYIYVVQKSHYDKFNLKYMLNFITPGCKIVLTEGVTEGAACTTLLAKEHINEDKPLLIANSDQYVLWNSSDFCYFMKSKKCDGGILTFHNTHPKWSYVKTDEDNNVTEIKEKQVISDMATVGIYYWAKGSEYVGYAEKMILENRRVNNEFYVAPVYEDAIRDGKKIKTYQAEQMWGLGTPEDLNLFLEKVNEGV